MSAANGAMSGKTTPANGVIHSGVRSAKSSNEKTSQDKSASPPGSKTKSPNGVDYLPKNGQLNYDENIITSPRLPEDPPMMKLAAIDPADEQSPHTSQVKSSNRKKSSKKKSSRRKKANNPPPILPIEEMEEPPADDTQRDGSPRYIVQSPSRTRKQSQPREEQPKSNRRTSETHHQNIHYDSSSVIGDAAPSSTRSHSRLTSNHKSSHRSSNRESSNKKPVTPMKKFFDESTDGESSSGRKPEIYVGGQRVTSDTKSSAKKSQEGKEKRRTAKTSSRRKLQDQKEALDETLKNIDGENVESAIHAALSMSRKHAIQDALDNDEQFRAKALESMTRPNDISDAIDELVSMRRSEILMAKEAKESRRREVSAKKKSKKRGTKKRKPKPAPVPIQQEDTEDPIIETIDEPSEIDEWVTSDSEDDWSDTTGYGGRADRFEDEENVRLPNAMRKAKEGEKYALGPPDALGQRDNVYDPLNADIEFNPHNKIKGENNPYEESSEDEDLMTIEERKDEMIYRFRLIQEAYPGIALPRITMKMKLAKMVRHYEFVESRLKLRSKTKNLRILLVFVFLAIQFGVKWLTGLNTAGFTANQMKCIRIYEKYLREFGESNWAAFGENTSIWIRLPFAIAVNFAIFIGAKYAMKYTKKDHTVEFQKLYSELTGDDSYTYLNADHTKTGLDAGDEGGEGGGLFGMLQKVVGMFGGGEGGGGGLMGMFGGAQKEGRPARGATGGATYVRKPREG
tara:strand:- start:120084 stop:122303 length:2220 start_codon:yes stop_codon:yes gene_type:complete